MYLCRVTPPSRDCGMRHLGNKCSTGRQGRCGKPGRRRQPMTCPCRCLHGSWGHVGRKPRVFRCLASKTRHRGNRGFLPACPCDPRRQAGGWRLLPISRVLLFAHCHSHSTISDLETPVCRAPFLPALPQRNKSGQKQKTGEDFCCSPRQLRAPARPG
jgi:hypothetical protein